MRKIPPKFVWRYEKSVGLCKALNLPNLFMSNSSLSYHRLILRVIHDAERSEGRKRMSGMNTSYLSDFSTGDNHPQSHFIIFVFLIFYSGDDNQWKALILFSSIIWVSGL